MEISQLIGFPMDYYNLREDQIIIDGSAFSSDNEFIPVNAFQSGSMYTGDSKRLLFYDKRVRIPSLYGGTGKFQQFTEYLMFNPDPNDHNNGLMGLQHSQVLPRTYYSTPGALLAIDAENKKINPLMLLTVKRSYVFDVHPRRINPDHFSLVIDKSCLTNEEHFKVYRSVKKYYVDLAEPLIDIVYTNDINKLCYTPPDVSIPSFRTIEERDHYNDEINEVLTQFIQRGA